MQQSCCGSCCLELSANQLCELVFLSPKRFEKLQIHIVMEICTNLNDGCDNATRGRYKTALTLNTSHTKRVPMMRGQKWILKKQRRKSW